MKFIVFLIFFLIHIVGYSQKQTEVITLSTYFCSYYGGEPSVTINGLESDDDAEKIIDRIVSVIGLKPNFEVRASDVPNAAAIIYQNQRFVLYNSKFVERLNKSAGSDWASASILAHEIGHHLNGHTLSNAGSRPDIELEADEFSGFVLRKLGATLKDAQVAMNIAADIKASHTHPAKADRLMAIANGWRNADDQIAGKSTAPKSNKQIEKPVIIKDPPKVESPALAEKYIAFDVHFYADSKGIYYVTIRNNLVKVENNELNIVGVMAESNKKKYSAMLYDKYYNYLYITSNGSIVNGSGKTVGKITSHE